MNDMRKIYKELAQLQNGDTAEINTEAGANKILGAVNAATVLAKYTRSEGWINIDCAFKKPDVTSVPLYRELKFITECYLYDGEDYWEFNEDDIWTYYYSGAYSYTDAFIFLYYIYIITLIKEEYNPDWLTNLSAFLMPDCVRKLLPNYIEEQKVSYDESEKQREQRRQDTENIDFDEIKAQWLDEGRETNEDYALLDFIILNMTDEDLKTFAGAHAEKPTAIGLLSTVGGTAANRFYGAMTEEQKNSLESKFREYPYTPKLWETDESTKLLLTLADEGKISIPGGGFDFLNATAPHKTRDIKDCSIEDLFYRIEEGGIIALAVNEPYVLANSSLLDGGDAEKRLEETLPAYIFKYIVQKREKYLDRSEIEDYDRILCEQIAEMAQNGKIRVNTSRYSRKERRD